MVRLYAFLYLPFLLFTVVCSSHRVGLHTSRRADAIRRHFGPSNDNTTAGAREAIHSRDQTIDTMRDRRVTAIVSSLSATNDDISSWLSSLKPNGQWPDVDYTTGCAAQRANWPAQAHWSRLKIMAGAWHGGVPGVDQYVNDQRTLSSTLLGMQWWFDHDFTSNPDCLDNGGNPKCPCSAAGTSDNPVMWNTNWYSSVIGTPLLVSQACLVLNSVLSGAARDHCDLMSRRSYAKIDQFVNGAGHLTGANTLDVSKIGIDLALFASDSPLLDDAYKHVHAELAVRSDVKADGIRSDGSFGQHAGILYNGNYGKDYANDILDLELIARGTQYTAGATSRAAFSTLFDGNQWMVYFNVLSGKPYWDFSVLGRFISFPIADFQATSGLKMDLSSIALLGADWGSAALQKFSSIGDSGNTVGANAGKLQGNRVFYDNDYMVHRSAKGFVSTLKMFSTRTKNTECTNSQNPFGFHLSDGVLHTYQRGNEYEDISAAWDWEKIPGTTVDYGATPLTCDRAGFTGVTSFVGGVSTGSVGIGAMRYINPYTKTLQWQKTWFFLPDDVQHVMVSGLASTSGKPVYSILDQKRHAGSVALDSDDNFSFASGQATRRSRPSTLWHDGVGYIFSKNSTATLSIQVGERTGDWKSIGISSQPPVKVDLFTAWLEHDPKSLATPISYTAFPGLDKSTFRSKSRQFTLGSTTNTFRVSAVYASANRMAMVVFWDQGGGTVSLDITSSSERATAMKIDATANCALIYDRTSQKLFISDPSQMVDSTQVTISFLQNGKEITAMKKIVSVKFPRDGQAGSTQMRPL